MHLFECCRSVRKVAVLIVTTREQHVHLLVTLFIYINNIL